MKKILILFFVILSVFLIYLGLKDDKVFYLSISDNGLIEADYKYNEYLNNYLDEIGELENYVNISDNNYRIIDIINSINNNEKYNDKTFKNILIKADFLTLEIGNNDILSKMEKIMNFKDYAGEYLNDLEDLYKLLRQYCKEDIVMIGYYSDDSNNLNYLEQKTKALCEKYNIKYLDIEDIRNINISNQEKNRTIFNKVRKIIDDDVLD